MWARDEKMSSQFRELFMTCCFTLSENFQYQNKCLIQSIQSLGFTIKAFDPLVIEKRTPSAKEIEELIKIVDQALAPQVEDDLEETEQTKLSVFHQEDRITPFAMETADSGKEVALNMEWVIDAKKSVADKQKVNFIPGSPNVDPAKSEVFDTRQLNIDKTKPKVSGKQLHVNKEDFSLNFRQTKPDKKKSNIDEKKPVTEENKFFYDDGNQCHTEVDKQIHGEQSNDDEEKWNTGREQTHFQCGKVNTVGSDDDENGFVIIRNQFPFVVETDSEGKSHSEGTKCQELGQDKKKNNSSSCNEIFHESCVPENTAVMKQQNKDDSGNVARRLGMYNTGSNQRDIEQHVNRNRESDEENSGTNAVVSFSSKKDRSRELDRELGRTSEDAATSFLENRIPETDEDPVEASGLTSPSDLTDRAMALDEKHCRFHNETSYSLDSNRADDFSDELGNAVNGDECTLFSNTASKSEDGKDRTEADKTRMSDEECYETDASAPLSPSKYEEGDSAELCNRIRHFSQEDQEESLESFDSNGNGASHDPSLREDDELEECITRHIIVDNELAKNHSLLRHVVLLPRRMNCSELKLSMDKINKGVIIVEGKESEVFRVEGEIKSIWAGKEATDEPSLKSGHEMPFKNEESSTARESEDSSVKPVVKNMRKTKYDDTAKAPKEQGSPHSRYEHHETEIRGSSSDQPGSQAEEFVTNYSAVTVKVLKGDITTQKVDAIVNAANSRLKHNKGVAKAISAKAGPELQRECDNFTRDGWGLHVTDVFVSSGGNLRARHVIHAVSPKWKAYGKHKKEECGRDLRRTILRCLLEADQQGFRSVAIPSIGAGLSTRQANFSVPIPTCTTAYLEAVQTYDIYKANVEPNRSRLHKILFVDVAENMVTNIKQRFLSQWSEEPSLQQVTEDLTFACENYGTISLRDDSSLSAHQGDESYLSERAADNSQGAGHSTMTQRSPEKYPYSFGNVMLRASKQSAFKQKPDLTVVVGDVFPNLHWSQDVNMDEFLPANKKFPEREGSFKAFGGLESSPLTFQLPFDDFNQGSFKKALATLEEVINSFRSELQHVKSVVFTSSALYSSYLMASAFPTEVDEKLVEAFTTSVYEFLELFTPPTGTLHATIAAGKDALPKVRKIIDAMQQKMNKSQEKGGSRRECEESQIECGVCLLEDVVLHPLSCCSGELCVSCKERLRDDRCPFCRAPFTCFTGNQPKGKMRVKLEKHIKLKGFEKLNTITITYDFPNGRQGEDHPNPGRAYDGTTRVAYLPASEEGYRVLRLLRVAFLRGLTFTIGDSLTTGRSGVIVWNDIHHKTSLNDGSPFGYPDSGYFQHVTEELEGKNVTLRNLTRDEKADVEQLERSLKSSSKR